MESIRNNKFMSGFIAIMVLGVIGLGYLIYSSYGHYDEVAQEFDKQVAELQRLEKLTPYPDNTGLQKFSELRQQYIAEVDALQTKLADFEPPADKEVITPIQFADKLRKTVEEISGSAQAVGMALPANFYMGFEIYRGTPPEAGVTPLLSRQLDAVSDLMRLLIKHRVVSLNSIRRAPLPREAGAASTPPPAARPGVKGPVSAADLIVRNPIEIAITSQPSAFREVLNGITSAERLYVIRAIDVKNKEPKGPLRDDPAATVQGGIGPTFGQPTPPMQPNVPNPNGVPEPQLPGKENTQLHYVVGLEKVDASLRIELVKVDPLQSGAK